MADFQFSDGSIDHFVEKIGIDVRPAFEVTADRIRIQDFYNRVSTAFPHLFETLTQGPGSIEFGKKVTIPGKGIIGVTTFSVTARGVAFSFPRRLPELGEEWPWPDNLNPQIIECIEMLKSQIPGTKFVKVGKIRELVFATQEVDSSGIVADRFCSNVPPGISELGVKWNQGDDRYNRLISIQAVHAQSVVVQQASPMSQPLIQPTGHFGVAVSLDINNKDMEQDCDSRRQLEILDDADRWYHSELIQLLNRGL